jgi:hypothetical protein
VIDFLVGDVGLEVKTQGSVPAIFQQLQRYASFAAVRSLLLVTTRLRYGALDGQTLLGKRVRLVRVVGGFV